MALVQIQETPQWKKVLGFFGPGFLVAVAYLDPGNLETDLQAGADHKYELLWIVLAGLTFALIIQSRSANLGVATGKHLSEHCKTDYPNPIRYVLWILAEIAVIAADIPQVIGTAFALNILLNVPIWGGVLLAGLNTLLLLGLQRYGIRKLEVAIGILVFVVGGCFCAVMAHAKPNANDIVKGMFIPKLSTSSATRDAIALLGALIMPHNLFLHSALVISRKISRSIDGIRTASKYFLLESAIALFIAFLINVAVISVTGSVCSNPNITLENKNHCENITLNSAAFLLKNALGKWSSKLYAVSLLASGQSSTVTGTYAGQYIMQGFLDLKLKLWLRNLVTRCIAIAPSLIVCIIGGPSGASRLIIIASMILSFELPFALVPLLKFTSSEAKMGEHKNSIMVTLILWLLGSGSIGINVYFLGSSLLDWITSNGMPKASAIFTGLLIVPVSSSDLFWTKRAIVPKRFKGNNGHNLNGQWDPNFKRLNAQKYPFDTRLLEKLSVFSVLLHLRFFNLSNNRTPNLMDNFQLNPFEQNQEINFLDPSASSFGFDREKAKILNQETEVFGMEEDETEESLADSMVCDSGSRLVRNGFTNPNSKEEIVLFVNAGAMTSIESDFSTSFLADTFFEGGDTFQTEEFISEGGDYPFLYQSARLGNFCYHINNLSPGDYFLDLHFVEIINTYGPKGMRVFNVFMQDEKILSDFDIFSIVGANKPLQLVDTRFSIKDIGMLVLRFEGTLGSPVVSGICVRRAPKESVPQVNRERFVCNNCATEMEYPSPQKKLMRMKSIAKYEKIIQELRDLLQRKTDECYQSWMSWTAANEQLESVRMELDNKTFRTYSLDQALEVQAVKLRDISSKYERDKKSWAILIDNLEKKVKVMKQEHSQLSREAHDCADSIPNLNNMVFAVQGLVEQCEDLKMKYNEEQTKRRKLYNQVQEAKGNIRVFCRCRPLSKTEVLSGCVSVVDFDAAKDGELGILTNGSIKKTFKFDRVYTPKDDQVDVFADASPVVISVLDGYNVCIFAYGQTGTGKTFTMEGIEANRGVNYRTLEELFKIASERRDTCSYSISVSVLEVYNEQIRDLLATETSRKLEIKQASEGCHHIPGIVEAKVENTREVWNVLQAGSSARAVGSNNVNEHSSRSHCMLCVVVRAKNFITGECTKSKLWLVDLAGSERLARTDVQGERLKEAQNINRSLSALGDVISALANKSNHVPYRNSKLTHLLQDSLGGDSKTLMFVQISPSDQDSSESLSSLNFATRVRGVELGPVRKQIDVNELQKMKILLDKTRQESRSKDDSLKKLEEHIQNLESKAKGKDQIHKNHLDKLKELEGQVEFKTSLHCQTEKQVLLLSDRLKAKEEIAGKLQQKVMDLESKLKEREKIESTFYQKKVNDLENKMKEQVQEAESCSAILRQKVKELETKLKLQEQNPESLLFQQKIKQLEDKLRELEKLPSTTMISESANSLRSTPVEGKKWIRDEITNEAEHRILRSINSVNRRVSQGPVMVKDNDSLHEARTKRLSRNSETENISVIPTPVSDNKARHSDPPKPFAKTSRTTKPIVPAQRPMVRNKTSRDPIQAIKERDSKKRMWSR